MGVFLVKLALIACAAYVFLKTLVMIFRGY